MIQIMKPDGTIRLGELHEVRKGDLFRHLVLPKPGLWARALEDPYTENYRWRVKQEIIIFKEKP